MTTITTHNNSSIMKELLNRAEFDLPKEGDVIEGEIISASKNNIFIDLGSFGTGIVYPGEFYDNPNMQKSLKTGQKISAVLINIETEEGFRELSLKQAQKTTAWHEIKKLKDEGRVIETTIININKGGAIVEIHGIQGFLPLSQLSAENYPRVEGGDTTKIVQHLQKLKNKEVKVKIIDFNEEENKLIVSEKAIGDEMTRKEVDKFKVGDVVDGIITSVTDFGAFVSITTPTAEGAGADTPSSAKASEGKQKKNEGKQNTESESNVSGSASVETTADKKKSNVRAAVEGLIHISEIGWKLIDDPHDFLKKGQEVKAKIINIEGTKISLSLKALKSDPWQSIEKKYSVGKSLKVTVLKVNNYGVLAALDEEIIGLIPISEFAGKKPAEVVKPGDKVEVTIVSVDPKDHKLILTLTAADKISKPAEPENKPPENKPEEKEIKE